MTDETTNTTQPPQPKKNPRMRFVELPNDVPFFILIDRCTRDLDDMIDGSAEAIKRQTGALGILSTSADISLEFDE